MQIDSNGQRIRFFLLMKFKWIYRMAQKKILADEAENNNEAIEREKQTEREREKEANRSN